MWDFCSSSGYGLENRLKKLRKKNSTEIEQVFKNLETYAVTLRNGSSPLKAFENLRFVRNEKEGLFAIDQSPLNKGYLALRLYVFPCEASKKLHVLQVGDKDQQPDDVRQCHGIVRDLKKENEKTAEVPNK